MKRLLATFALFLALVSPSSAVGPTQAEVITKALRSVGHVVGLVEDMDGIKHQTGCSAVSISPRKFLTAAHCIVSDLRLDGKVAAPIAVDTERDLAVLLVDDTRPSLRIRAKALHFLEEVIGIGYGYSFLHPTVTYHHALMFHYSPEKDVYPGTWFQGGVIGGMSGGAFIDADGEIVGTVQRGNAQIGYGVDSGTINEFLQEVK